MKKKFLVLTLCFTLIFSSLNYKKSYADAGVISLPMLATVSALAIGAGIVLNDIDDIYDIGHIFYEKNKSIWNTVVATFNSCVAFNKTTNKLFVDKPFIDIFKNTFKDYNDNSNGDYVYSSTLSSAFDYVNVSSFVSDSRYVVSFDHGVSFEVYRSSRGDSVYINGYLKGVKKYSGTVAYNVTGIDSAYLLMNGFVITLVSEKCSNFKVNLLDVVSSWGLSESVFNSVALPYSGSFDDTLLDDKDDIYLPGDLGDLVNGGISSGDILGDSPFPGFSSGDVVLPDLSDPSIGVDTSVSFPTVGSSPGDTVVPPSDSVVPNDSLFSKIKDFIISLVVPSDTYWTDTWGGLYNNFTNSFPMVDMDGFNDLVTGEKKFPNIDVDIMGVTGRVVNGDIINSIVDWLRPIIAGFMMLCLMLFNYRKIYKLIRNTEPFGGIAPGTSDFSTGISEYSKQEVVKATDMVAEYKAWKERGGK